MDATTSRDPGGVAGDPAPVGYLVAGANGMLGHALQRVLSGQGRTRSAPSEESFDITDSEAVLREATRFAEELAPGQRGVLVNAAAYTNVEGAEDEAERAYRVNETGARILAVAARSSGLGFVHVSTDFVFDGTKDRPYVETDPPGPLSVYGASKLAGERAVAAAYPDALIVRTAWAFGPAGANFVTKVLDTARARGSLRVVDDEIGSPTYTVDLAVGILGLVEAGATGVYHLAGADPVGTVVGPGVSRYDLALEILSLAGLGDVPVAPVSSSAFTSKAARPANSVLDCAKAAALGVTMPPWPDGLARFIAETSTA
jgi:dTDP-4-dehydrorhamnose reductase